MIELKAAVTGKSIYVTRLLVSTLDVLGDTYASLYDGIALVTVFGPVALQIDGSGTFEKQWKYPLKLSIGSPLSAYSKTSGGDGKNTGFYVEGYVA